MNISTRAANQLHAIDPEHVAVILDRLRSDPMTDGTHLVEIDVPGHRFRCFVARHRDGSRVLLGVVEPRGP